jgi:hypothetical protein
VAGVYDQTVDRESAYERLKGRAGGSTTPGAKAPAGGGAAPAQGGGGWSDLLGGLLGGSGKTGRGDSVIEAAAKSAARSMATTAGRELVRGVLGTLLGGSSRRR